MELTPHLDDAGRCRGLFAVTTDVTERRREEALRLLGHTVAELIAAADSTSAAVQAVIHAICETEHWDCGRYFAADPKAGVARFAAGWGVDHPQVQAFLEGSRGLTYRPGEGLSGRVWQSAQPLWVPDVFSDARSAQPQLNRATGMHGAFVFPVIADGRESFQIEATSGKITIPVDEAPMRLVVQPVLDTAES